MIGFLLPGFLYAAGAVALGVVALHLLVTEQPKSDLLPTVRFFPDVVARSTSITVKPSDLWLLLLRVLTILLIGAAFAQPQLRPRHRAVARIVALDLSRAVGRRSELADSARAWTADAATTILFDDRAWEASPSAAADSLRDFAARREERPRGAITPALITALRAASRLRESADSIELVIVSPFVQEETDAATRTVRGLLPGHIRTVRVAAAPGAAPATTARPTVEWADSGATTLWEPRRTVDTIGAVRAGNAVLVFPFVRRWRLRLASDSTSDQTTRVYARWSDGEPAAVERRIGADCIRSLAIAMPTVGDAVLRPEFVRFAEALATPCGPVHDYTPLSATAMSMIEGAPSLTPAAVVRPRSTHVTPLVPWLLGGALLLALLELLLRRRIGDPPAADRSATSDARRPAA